MSRDDLRSRLGNAARGLTVPHHVRQEHRALLDAVVRSSPQATGPRRTVALRRRLAFVLLTALVGLVAVGVVSQSALPGQPLYGVKRLLERATAAVDPDRATDHRLSELDRLIADRAQPASILAAQVAAYAQVRERAGDDGRRLAFDRLVVGGRSADGTVIDAGYDVIWDVDWGAHASLVLSLPGGELLEVARSGVAVTIAAGGSWIVEPANRRYWQVRPRSPIPPSTGGGSDSPGPTVWPAPNQAISVAVYDEGPVHITILGDGG